MPYYLDLPCLLATSETMAFVILLSIAASAFLRCILYWVTVSILMPMVRQVCRL